jgi:hypothetical protein
MREQVRANNVPAIAAITHRWLLAGSPVLENQKPLSIATRGADINKYKLLRVRLYNALSNNSDLPAKEFTKVNMYRSTSRIWCSAARGQQNYKKHCA